MLFLSDSRTSAPKRKMKTCIKVCLDIFILYILYNILYNIYNIKFILLSLVRDMENANGALVRRCADAPPATISQFPFVYPILPAYPMGSSGRDELSTGHDAHF